MKSLHVTSHRRGGSAYRGNIILREKKNPRGNKNKKKKKSDCSLSQFYEEHICMSNSVVADLDEAALTYARQRLQELQQQLMQMDEEKELSSSVDQSLHDFILDQSKIELRSDAVYRAVLACCRNSLSDQIPTAKDIAYEILHQKECTCFMGQDMNAMIAATEHALLNHSTTNCNVIARIFVFYRSEHRYPTTRELEQVETQLRAVLNPTAQENSAKRPCPGLEKLKSQKAKKIMHQACCICQSDIARGSNMIKLTPCGHIFHDKTRNCPGIRPWLQDHTTCPVCIKNVEIA